MKRLFLLALCAMMILACMPLSISAANSANEAVPELVITEISRKPSGGAGVEWVEIYNASDEAIDLYNYKLVYSDAKSIEDAETKALEDTKITSITDSQGSHVVQPGKLAILWMVNKTTYSAMYVSGNVPNVEMFKGTLGVNVPTDVAIVPVITATSASEGLNLTLADGSNASPTFFCLRIAPREMTDENAIVLDNAVCVALTAGGNATSTGKTIHYSLNADSAVATNVLAKLVDKADATPGSLGAVSVSDTETVDQAQQIAAYKVKFGPAGDDTTAAGGSTTTAGGSTTTAGGSTTTAGGSTTSPSTGNMGIIYVVAVAVASSAILALSFSSKKRNNA